MQSEQTRQRGWWILQLPNPDESLSTLPRWFISGDGNVTARPGASVMINIMLQQDASKTYSHSPDEPALLLEVDKSTINLGFPRESLITTAGKNRFYIEPLSSYGTVYIFGAGHVSQKLAVLTGMVGFRTVVLDDRVDFANEQRFPTTDSVIVIKDNQKAFQELVIDKESYLVIVTRGHLHDKVILQQALMTDAVYIGMIGSKRKREEIYRALEVEGVQHELLEKVYSPIGLPIGAESPEEIAVSITAELIQARNDHIKSKL
jgi:xanthine dehydrogenase accessory factor